MIVGKLILRGIFATYFMDVFVGYLVKRNLIYLFVTPEAIGRCFLYIFIGLDFIYSSLFYLSSINSIKGLQEVDTIKDIPNTEIFTLIVKIEWVDKFGITHLFSPFKYYLLSPEGLQ